MFVQTHDFDSLSVALEGELSLSEALSPLSHGQLAPPSPRGAVCSVRPLLTARHGLPLGPQYYVFWSAELSAGPAVLFCDSGLLLISLQSAFLFPPLSKHLVFLTPAQLSPPALVQTSPTLLLTPGAQPSFFFGWWWGLRFVCYTHPAFSCRESGSGQRLWFRVCGI